MNCVEFRQILPEAMSDAHRLEDNQHLQSCPQCLTLVRELNLITVAAKSLRAADEPSPRVWNSLEIELRREGLIRGAVPATRPRWSWWKRGWLVPAAAAFLFTFGLIEVQNGSGPADLPHTHNSVAEIAVDLPPADQQLLEEMAVRQPADRAQYAVNLRNVNNYIRDAEQSARNDPNDEEAQRDLMDAYQQRAMVYRLALDRSLP